MLVSAGKEKEKKKTRHDTVLLVEVFSASLSSFFLDEIGSTKLLRPFSLLVAIYRQGITPHLRSKRKKKIRNYLVQNKKSDISMRMRKRTHRTTDSRQQREKKKRKKKRKETHDKKTATNVHTHLQFLTFIYNTLATLHLPSSPFPPPPYPRNSSYVCVCI